MGHSGLDAISKGFVPIVIACNMDADLFIGDWPLCGE